MREEMRRTLKSRQLEFSEDDCQQLTSNLELMPELMAGESLSAYMAIGYEPDLRLLLSDWLSASKKLYLPRYETEQSVYSLVQVRDLGEDLETGRYGIPEPREGCSELRDCEDVKNLVWLIPGLAFNRRGVRLGRGGGYYDRLLVRYPGAFRVGVCRDCQLLDEEIETESHDVLMDAVVTEKQVLYCR